MLAPSEQLRRQARRIVDAALERVPLQAALLAGSAGRGDADFYSDLDLLFYVDEVPPDDALEDIRTAVGGVNPIRREASNQYHAGEEFTLERVRTEISFTTVARVDSWLAQLLDELDDVASPLQKIASGIAEGLPLHGEELVQRWRNRITPYPDALRVATIKSYWNLFPLWYHGEAMVARDTELWRVEMLVDTSLNLLGVLAALNRIYFSRFELKRMRALTAKMQLAPPRLADRLESLFTLAPELASAELGRLVTETRALVAAELPDLDLPLRFSPGTRQQPWSI